MRVANPANIRNADVQRAVPGLFQFLKDANKLGKEFNRELKNASVEVSKHVVKRAQARASTPQERLVAKALQPKFDRVPQIRIRSSAAFASKSRPNRGRSAAAKVKAIDVFYGIEFGGGKYGKGNPKPRKNFRDGVTRGGKHAYTTQFRPHAGRRGYFFYPTVRDEGKNIERMYGEAVQRVLTDFGKGRL